MAKPRSIGGRGCNVGQNTPNLERAITHRRLSETARRAEIRNQRAILRTASGETGESFPRLKLKSHSPCGDARTVEKRTKTIPNESRTGDRLILPESVNRRFSDSKGTSRLPLNRYGVSPHRDPLQTTVPGCRTVERRLFLSVNCWLNMLCALSRLMGMNFVVL